MLEKAHIQSGNLSAYCWQKITYHLPRGAKLLRKASPISILLLLLVLITIPVLLQFQSGQHEPSWTSHPIQLVRPTPITSPPGSLIPPKIWQIVLPHDLPDDQGDAAAPRVGLHQDIDPSQLVDTPSWLAQNPDHAYKLVTSQWASSFVNEHLSSASSPRYHHQLAQIYHALPNPGLKSDLLRYLLLSVEGGVYTDIDTIALQPIDKWLGHLHDDDDTAVLISSDIQEEGEKEGEEKRKIGLIVGIEFDQRDGVPWADIPHPVQFCQWTIAAAPRHPVFDAMLVRVFESLLPYFPSISNSTEIGEEAAADNDSTSTPPPPPPPPTTTATNKSRGRQWRPTSFEVMNSTGPAAWTDVVFAQLQQADPALTDLRNLSGMDGPRRYGDILVLPIDGFGVGQVHSGSTNDGSFPEDAFVKHNFRGSWREPTPP